MPSVFLDKCICCCREQFVVAVPNARIQAPLSNYLFYYVPSPWASMCLCHSPFELLRFQEDCRAKWTIDRAVLPTDDAAADSAEPAGFR